METNLRPLTLGEILDRTAQLYRTNFLLFAGIFSFYAGVGLVLNLAQLGLAQWLKSANLLVKFTWVTYAVGGVEGLILVLLLGAAIAAISRAVASLHLGEPITIRDAYKSTLPQLGRYLWLMFLTGLRAWSPMVILWAGLIVFIIRSGGFPKTAPGAVAAAPTADQQQALVAIGIAFIVLGLLSIPAAVYTIWMSIRYSLAVPASVVENLKARVSIRRSIELSKGARWRIFALGLLVFAIKLGIGAVSQFFVLMAAFRHPGHISVQMNVTSQIIQFFTNTFLGPIGATGVTLFYFDQRVRKEGYDIEWMMQAAGMSHGESAASTDLAPAPVEAVAPLEAVVEVAQIAPELTATVPEGVTDTPADSAHE
ncbi:MAG TPA: hypothetical protein VGJ21_06800 [Terracidiphilus sp.]|jgi:hypothetical protein